MRLSTLVRRLGHRHNALLLGLVERLVQLQTEHERKALRQARLHLVQVDADLQRVVDLVVLGCLVSLIARPFVHALHIVRPHRLETGAVLFECFDGRGDHAAAVFDILGRLFICHSGIVVDEQATHIDVTARRLPEQILVRAWNTITWMR